MTSSTETRELTAQAVLDYKYNLNEIVTDKIYSMGDMSLISPQFINDVKEFQATFERPVIIAEMFNRSTIDKLEELIKTKDKLFIFALPSTEECVDKAVGDRNNDFEFSFGSDYFTKTKLKNEQMLMPYDWFNQDLKNYFDQMPERTSSWRINGIRTGSAGNWNLILFNKNFCWFRCDVFKTEQYSKIGRFFKTSLFDFYNRNKLDFYLTKEELMIRKTVEDMKNFFYYSTDHQLGIINSKIRENNKTIRDIYKRVCLLERENGEQSTLLRSLKTRKAKENKQFYNDKNLTENFSNLIGEGKYTNFEFSFPYIIAYTDMIKVSSFDKEYDIGKFEIKINFRESYIKFFNLTNEHRYDSDTTYQHPHIMNSQACFGNYKEHINTMLVNNDTITLLQTLLAFLKEYNDGRYGGRPFVLVEKYWGKREDWNSDLQLPTRHPDAISNREEQERIDTELLSVWRERYPNIDPEFGQTGTCDCCGDRIYVCLDNDGCGRSPLTGEYEDTNDESNGEEQ